MTDMDTDTTTGRGSLVRAWTSNSLYEIDRQRRVVRRVLGQHPPTERQGHDGEWRSFESVTDPVVGEPLMIVWSAEGSRALGTVTSPVVEISEA